jgi:4-amino-4-deoxy-L-arabinose transferase-like glycosyltransferase
MTRSTLETEPIQPKGRWLTGLLGLAAIIAGQARLASDAIPLAPPSELGVWLNEELHLAIPSIDNVLTGLPLLLGGAVLLGLALRGLRLLPAERSFKQAATPAIRVFFEYWYLVLLGSALFGFLLLRLKAPDIQWYQVPLWLTALGVFAFLAFKLDQNAKIDVSPQLTRKDLLWLLGLCLGGILIGSFRLEGFPDQLIGDEGNFWNIARDIAQGTLRPSLFGIGVYTFPVFSSMLQGWFMWLFGINVWGWRLSSVLTGLLTLPPLYLLARDAFNRKIAIASSVVLITSPYFLAFSRLGYNNIQALFVTTLAFYWLYAGLKRRSSLYYYLAGCTAGFGFYVYFSARLVIVAVILMLACLGLVRKIKFREAFQAAITICFAFILVVVPHFVYGLYHDPQALSYKTFESVFFNTFNGLQFYSEAELYAVAPPFVINGNEMFYHPGIYLEIIARGLIRTLLAFQKPWLISEHYIASPLTGTIGVLFYLIGIALVAWRFKQPRSLMLLLWFFFNVLGLSTLNTVPPRHTHMVAIIPALAILTAVGIHALTTALASFHRYLAKHSDILIAFLILLVAVGGLRDYFIEMPKEYRPHPDQVILWAALNADKETLVYVYTDPNEKDLYPNLLKEYRDSIAVRSVPLEAMKRDGTLLTSDNPTIVFYLPEIGDTLDAILQDAWKGSFIGRSFYSSNGTQILKAGMNAPFVFEGDKSLGTVLWDTFAHASLLILVAAFLLVILLAATFQTLWQVKLPAPLKRFGEWFIATGYDEPEGEEEQSWVQPQSKKTEDEEAGIEVPPEWALDHIPPAPAVKHRFQLEIKPVKSTEGLDVYVRIKFPRVKFSFLSLRSTITNRPVLALPELHIPNKTLLICAVFAAITGQVFISFLWLWAGCAFYLLAAFTLITWSHKNPKWRNAFHHQIQITPIAEAILFVCLIVFMTYIRFFDLSYRVYGLEADETKWTVQSWYSTILNLDIGEFSSMHYKHVPVDFWIRSFFLRLFGLNFFSPRIESAVLSLISLAFLYLIIRLITNNPASALLGALLYGISFIELNASHQALHNTPIEPWIMGAIFFLVWGLLKRSLWKFQLTGIFLSLGMLTYETFYPTVLLVLGYVLGVAIYEIRKKRESVRNWLGFIALLLWPVILTYLGFTQDYLSTRKYYIFGWLWRYSENGVGGEGTIYFIFKNIVNLFNTIFSQVVFRDSLLNWPGPLLSPLLLPFVVIGFIYNIWNIKQPHFAFVIVWFFAQILPGPVITGSVWPRVLFTAIGPLIIWGMLGLWVCFAALRAWADLLSIRFAVPIFVILVIAILANNYYVFSSALIDPVDRQRRRELADLTAASTRESDMLLFPYIAYMEESAEVENHVILFSVAGARHSGLEAEEFYKRVEYKDLLATVWENRDVSNLDIIIEKSMPGVNDAKTNFIRVLIHCYPHATQKYTGRFFDVYSLSKRALGAPICYTPPAPLLTIPEDSASLPANTPITLSWDTNAAPMTGFSLQIDRRLKNVYWLEAEDDFTGAGWGTSADFVSGFNGKGFLLDDWEAGEAVHFFSTQEASPYRIWVRYYKRVDNDQQNYLKILGKYLEFAEPGSPLNQWAWKDLGVYSLPAGETPVSLTRSYGKDEQFSVFIDTVVLSPNTSFNPEKDSEWETVVNTGEFLSKEAHYTISNGLPPGYYRWKIRIFDGNLIVDALGERGIESSYAGFDLKP